MRTFRARHAVCDRAREWASLRLDGELSQLEDALLDAHLAVCSTCAEYVAELRATTTLLRTAEHVHPSRPVVLPPRRSALPRFRTVAAVAAAVAVAVGAGSLLGTSRRAPSGPAQPATSHIVVASADEQFLLREPRRLMRPGVKRGIGISV